MRNYKALGMVTLTWMVAGCDSGDASKSWAEFSRCMVGDGVSQSTEVAARLRSVELKERQPPKLWDAKSQWPGRCEGYASALYASLGSSTEHKLLKRALKGQVNCKDEGPPNCAFSPDGEILSAAQDLWDKAAGASLKQDPSVQVPLPTFDVELQSPEAWTPLASPDYTVADRLVTPSGVLRLLLKSADGPLTVCDAGPAGVSCSSVAAGAPKVAAQSVKLLQDEEAIITGLTTEGRKGFSVKTGEEVTFRGAIEGAARAGLVLEQGDAGVGFLAITLAKGKARATAAFEPQVIGSGWPVAAGATVSWLEPAKDGAVWRFGQVNGRKLKEVAAFEGDFAGDMSACNTASPSVAVWGRSRGQRDSKPTRGDATAVLASFEKDGAWSKPVSATMPFDRSLTGRRCGPSELEVFWAGSDSGELEVGEVTCTAAGCDVKSSKWPGFDVKRWIVAGPAKDKFVALWTTAFGETRFRVGAADSFANAEERVLFESHERGGPIFRDVESFFTPNGAYLLVNDKGPILLSLTEAGVQSLTAK